MNKVYLVDEGTLLEKSDQEYTAYAVYNKKYGYYDDDQYLTADLEKAKQACMKYVAASGDWAYGIITEQQVTDDQLSQIRQYEQTQDMDDRVELSKVHPDYTMDSVVFSVCKKQGVVIQDFIKKKSPGETV
jgi:hypothetical protein